jgi:hypothetical protein
MALWFSGGQKIFAFAEADEYLRPRLLFSALRDDGFEILCDFDVASGFSRTGVVAD